MRIFLKKSFFTVLGHFLVFFGAFFWRNLKMVRIQTFFFSSCRELNSKKHLNEKFSSRTNICDKLLRGWVSTLYLRACIRTFSIQRRFSLYKSVEQFVNNKGEMRTCFRVIRQYWKLAYIRRKFWGKLN